MKIFLITLILAALIQTSFLPIDLVLILLICRSFIFEEKENYYLAFFGGVMVGLLGAQNIGFLALMFLLTVKITHFLRRLPISSNILAILPVTFILVLLNSFVDQLAFSQTLDFRKILLEMIIVLPVFIILRFWEDRYVAKNEIKLKIKS